MTWSIFDKESIQAFDAAHNHVVHPYPAFGGVHEGSAPDTRPDQGDYDDLRLDLRAPDGLPDGLPDGFYTVVAEGLHNSGESPGAEIRDGYFVPEPTAMACYRAICATDRVTPHDVMQGLSPLNHIFIEHFHWDAESSRLIVGTGS